VRKIINRWSGREQTALKQLVTGASANQRFRGLRRSERNEAKLSLFAMLPVLLVAPFVSKWSDASLIERAFIMLTGAWMLAVLVAGGFFICRSLIRVSRNKHG